MADRTVVRCNLNKYQTPLFSFDEKGIYVHCKDCRRDTTEGTRRGSYHLITWPQILQIMVKATQKSLAGYLGIGEEVQKSGLISGVPSGSFIFDEITVANHDHSWRGGERAELDGSGLQISGSETPSPAHGPTSD